MRRRHKKRKIERSKFNISTEIVEEEIPEEEGAVPEVPPEAAALAMNIDNINNDNEVIPPADEDPISDGDDDIMNAPDPLATDYDGTNPDNMIIDEPEQKQETYEDLCRSHFEKFVMEAENYVPDTEMSMRVQGWKQKMRPILEQQDERAPFDIRKYAKRLLRSYKTNTQSNNDSSESDGDGGDIGKEIEFSKLVENHPPFEVCRLFLTALHLVNSENIQFQVKRRKYNGTTCNNAGDNIRCKLLSKKPPVDFESYRAPSLKKKSLQNTK